MSKKQKIIIVLLIFTVFVSLCAFRFNHLLEEYGQTALKNAVSTRINKCINNYVSENEEMFSALVHHEYNTQGKLCAIQLNSGKLSALQSGLEKAILQTVTEIETAGFEVPLGNLLSNRLFSGRGPKIKIQTVPLTTVACDTVNEFKSVGINHTIHSVGLVFKVSFKAAYPFGDTVFETQFSLSLCESIIIGEVPSVYVN
ncbi:MAG: sporulation protein YunB [Clostridia bacterium]|nr:sporulation protein YunB [Clostridia bacterium]